MKNQSSLTVTCNSWLAGGQLCIHTTHTFTIFLYQDWLLMMMKILFSEWYETQRLFHNKLTNMPCDALKYLFAREGLWVFENNYKNELQMVPLSRYSRSLFGLTSMSCGREKSDNDKAEKAHSVTCLFFLGYSSSILWTWKRENKPVWTGKQATEHINALLGDISSNYASMQYGIALNIYIYDSWAYPLIYIFMEYTATWGKKKR